MSGRCRTCTHPERDAIDRALVETWLIDFYHDRIDAPAAFGQFRDIAGNRYDLVAYLFFPKDLENYMPIAPTRFDEAFKLLGKAERAN